MKQVAFLEQTGLERASHLPPVHSKWQAKPGLEPLCYDKVKLIKGQDLMHDPAQVTPDTGNLLSLVPGANHISFLFLSFSSSDQFHSVMPPLLPLAGVDFSPAPIRLVKSQSPWICQSGWFPVLAQPSISFVPLDKVTYFIHFFSSVSSSVKWE